MEERTKLIQVRLPEKLISKLNAIIKEEQRKSDDQITYSDIIEASLWKVLS